MENINKEKLSIIKKECEKEFKKIYNDYIFFKIEDNKIKTIFNEVFNNTIKTCENNNLISQFKSITSLTLKQILKNEMQKKGNKKILQILTNIDFENKKETTEYLIKISNILDEIDYNYDIDLFYDYLKINTKFEEYALDLFDKNEQNNLYGHNKLILIIIEAYKLKSNFETVKNDDNYYNIDELDNISYKNQYYLEIKKIPVLSKEEEIEIGKKIKKGDKEAINILVKHNLRLVFNMVKKYLNYHNCSDSYFMDLVQEGNIGLIKAAKKFDYTKGYKFSTYATWWINQYINNSIYNYNTSKMIRIPQHHREKLNYFQKMINKMTDELNREPTMKEIAKKMNITETEVKDLYNDLSILNSELDSLDRPISFDEDNDGKLIDFIKSEQKILEDEFVSSNLVREIFELIDKFDKITPRDKLIFYKLNVERKKGVEIAKEFNIPKQRVSQIEIKVLKACRLSKKIKEFAIYTSNPKAAIKAIDDYVKNKENINTKKIKNDTNYNLKERKPSRSVKK